MVVLEAVGLVSIHAPREGCDYGVVLGHGWNIVSIHAPREGCDQTIRINGNLTNGFNPRTP